jgi:hypothetical protein
MAYPIKIYETAKLKDLGGTGDCGWRSIAAAIIDSYLCKEIRVNFDELMKIYQQHYPQDISAGTNPDFKKLIESQPPQELVIKLAYALRQLAVNEIVKNPNQYMGAFADKTEGTSPASMRGQHTWIDETGIAAIANALNIPIKVTSNSELKVPHLTYNAEARSTTKPLTIHFTGGHYIPEVKTNYFERREPVTADTVVARKTNANKTVNAAESQQILAATTAKSIEPQPIQYNDPSLKEIWAKIRQSEALDEQRELQVQQKLQKFTTNELIFLYRKTMPHSDYLPGKIRAVTREHGGDSFFKDAVEHGNAKIGRETETRNILIQALAKEEYIHPRSEVAKFLQDRGHGLSDYGNVMKDQKLDSSTPSPTAKVA